MSTPTVMPPAQPYHQWQNFYTQPCYGSDAYTNHEQLLVGVAGIAEQTKQQAANDIARDLSRSIDQNGMANLHSTERNAAILAANIERASALNAATTERVNSQLATAVERNGANNMSTTERVNSQLATAVERNGANGMSTTQLTAAQLANAIERNGATNQAAIERTTGEARLTTVVTDAASRQFANDSARDITRQVDHYGMLNMGSIKDAYNGLLGSIERNSGESRIQTLTSSGILGTALTDVRHSILNDVNRGTNEILAANTQNLNAITKSVTDSAWEQRTAAAIGFQHLGEEHLRTKQDITKTVSDSYSSLLLEQQKISQFLASKADGHFAMNQLETQKVKESIMSQSSNQFAIAQLELQKVKEGLAAQAAQQFAVNQLEQQKIREHLSNQLADAKYEQLKSQQFIAEKLCECCCSIKEKVGDLKEHASVIDRDRLRDNLSVSRDEANMLKLNEYNQLYWNQNNGGFGGFGGFGPWNGPWGGRGYGDGRAGYGNVYNNFDVDDRRRDDRRRDDRRRDDHHD